MADFAVSSGVAEVGWMEQEAPDAPRWYALYTRSNFERRVAEELTAKSLENFLPVFQQLHQWKDRKKWVDVPVFPGYVFAHFRDTPKTRLQVLRTTGTVRILGQAERIEPIPEAEIEAIRRLLKSNVPCFAHPFLREGAWVRVKRGALKNVEGLLVRVKSHTRLVLSISLLSQSVATEIDVADVEVLRPAKRPEKKESR